MLTNRLCRTLSAFNHSTRRWTPLPSQNPHGQVPPLLSPSSPTPNTPRPPTLSLTTWNLDAFSPRPISRANLIFTHILDPPKSPDIIFLQEVTSAVRASLLHDERIRAAFLVTDAEDQMAFEDVPFASMTLLSCARFGCGRDSQRGDDGGERGEKFTLGGVARLGLPSKYKRDALCVDIIPPAAPDTVVRLINVHLDSLGDTQRYRARQMEILANVLRERGCSGGVIAGDFNAISAEDEGLVEENGLVDAWVALHGRVEAGGETWGVGGERRDGRGPRRLDKVAMMGAEAREMEVLRPGGIEVPRPGEGDVEIPWSDHCGLRCNFVI